MKTVWFETRRFPSYFKTCDGTGLIYHYKIWLPHKIRLPREASVRLAGDPADTLRKAIVRLHEETGSLN